VTSAASPSTSLTGSEQLQTAVEVFMVTGTEAPDTGDDIEPELEELDNLSGHSSEAPCDCPAHVHDRDTPLLIDKGMSQAFSLFPIDLEAPRPITAPPTANLTPPPESETGDLASLKEVAVTPPEDAGGSAAPANTVRFADLSFKRSYSYGVLEKKWSL